MTGDYAAAATLGRQTNGAGTSIERRRFSKLRKRFYEALARVGLRRIRFHDLRHTFGTHCAAAGVPREEVAEVALADLGVVALKRLPGGSLPPLDVEVAAELLCRQVLSLLLTPASAAKLETADDARRFARGYLFTALTGRPPAH